MAVFLGGLGSVGFLPMDTEESIMIISKRNNIPFKEVIGILNALVDSEISSNDLEVKAKSGIAYQNKLAKKTKQIWNKAKSKYKGNLEGNLYYSSLRDIIQTGLLKQYKPYRKLQK